MDSITENILEPKNIRTERFQFQHFPAFAKFVRENHLIQYVKDQIAISHEVQLPLIKLFAHMPEDELIAMGMQSHADFLIHAENNKLHELLNHSLDIWEKDELGIVTRDDIATEDITLGAYVRKHALLKLLPLYTNDPQEIINIIREIDTYDAQSVKEATNTYIRILKNKIQEHVHFIESITNTIPGAIYVFDLINKKELYSNNKVKDLLGFTAEEMIGFEENIITELMHPDDIAAILEDEKEMLNAKDGEIKVIEYRTKDKNGQYKWMRNYRSVFKRDHQNVPTQIIGISLNVDEEKKNETRLRQSRKELLQAQEIAEVGSFIWHTDNDEMFVTPQFLKIYNLKESFKRTELLKGIHPADQKRLELARQKAIDELGIYDNEYRQYVNGKERILWIRGEVSLENGRKVMKGTVMDVTERKHMIKRLQRSEELYKQAQAMSHIGNWEWYITEHRLHWTDELYRIFGFDPEKDKIDYETYISCIHPDDLQMMQDEIQRCVAAHKSYEIYHRIITKDKALKYIHSIGDALLDSDGKLFKMYGTAQDITKEYYIEKQLRENREFIQKIADTTPSLIASYDLQTKKLTFINSAFETLLGYDTDLIYSKGTDFFKNIIHPEDYSTVADRNRSLLSSSINQEDPADEPVTESKYRMKNAAGVYRWFHTYSTVFDRNADGKVEHLLSVSMDITDQEEAEQKLYRKNIELQQSNSSLEEFAYVASHDLKEPLRKIATFGDRLVISQNNHLTEEGKNYLNKIIDSSKRMQTMISDLLSISTISGNRTYEVSNLEDILHETLQTLEYKIEEKNALIFADELPNARVVVSQFRQLFLNILSNALKFSKTDIRPHITITSKILDVAAVKGYDVAKAKQYLRLDFTDNGIGLDNKYAHKIFTIFQRLHGRSEYEGTGIGLAICKKIVENHGGVIFANGNPGQGTTFTVIIPHEDQL